MRVLKVTAKKGRLCPRENHRDKPIDDKNPVEVPKTAYYIRRIAEGSLITVESTAPIKDPEAAQSTGSKKKENKNADQ